MAIIDAINQFVSNYWQQGLIYALLGSGLIQIVPLKINPYSWIAKKLGRALNSEVLDRVQAVDKRIEEVDKRLEEHINWDAKKKAEAVRRHILIFAEELKRDEKRSLESYRQILYDIKKYNDYCDTHPDFENKMAVHAIAFIEEEYAKSLRENNFL